MMCIRDRLLTGLFLIAAMAILVMKGREDVYKRQVVDVVFEDGNLPEIKDALEVENNGKRCVMEVSHHLGNNIDVYKRQQ